MSQGLSLSSVNQKFSLEGNHIANAAPGPSQTQATPLHCVRILPLLRLFCKLVLTVIGTWKSDKMWYVKKQHHNNDFRKRL